MGQPAPNEERLLGRILDSVRCVPGVAALVLGGSRARGTATPHSDYDIGLYYEPGTPLDIAALRAVATALDDAGPNANVTPVGGWGPWIDGGGWLTIGGVRVDLLYRDLNRVESVIEQCRAGEFERHYQPGHPHAFLSCIYMGEVAYCRALWDPQSLLEELKQRTVPYPEELRAALIRTFTEEAKFALGNARHGSGLGDMHYVIGCVFRAIASLCQILFAINRVYLLNEKGAVAGVSALAARPERFAARVAAAYKEIAATESEAGLRLIDELIDEIRQMIEKAN